MSARRVQKSCVFDFETFKDIEDCMTALNIPPDGWGEESRYIEDAVKLKNALVKAGKWIPAEEVDIKGTQIKSLKRR